MRLADLGIIIKIAWKNLWRNRLRSAIVILSVVIGLWAGIFVTAFFYGISNQRLEGIIDTQLSDLQIHYPGFTDNYEPQYLIPEKTNLKSRLDTVKEIKAFSRRVITPGMISSATSGGGVMIKGIIPEDERQVTTVNQEMIEGDFFEDGKKNSIVMGEKLVNKLGVRLRSKVVLSMQDIHGNITSGAFRIVGIYRTSSAKFDEANVFVRAEDLSKLLGNGQTFHEVGILLKDHDAVDQMTKRLKKEFSGLQVESWKTLAPELDFMNRMMDEYLFIFMVIILLAMAFGILNTMLMAVLERTREFGMLMAIGMNKLRTFTMIMLESIFLTFTGVPFGLLLSIATIQYFGNYGIDLSFASQGLSSFDLDTIIYPTLEYSFYGNLIIMVIITAICSALYPAYKALKLRPADAIRTI